jgi:hypothetical protein
VFEELVGESVEKGLAIAVQTSIQPYPTSTVAFGFRDSLDGLFGSRARVTDHGQHPFARHSTLPGWLAIGIEKVIKPKSGDASRARAHE